MSYYNSRYNSRYDDRWPAYVPVAERRRKAAQAMEKLRKKGHPVTPVKIEGRAIATTFWGKAWCDNLERYRDYENRIERGRTYVRNGSVVDLQIAPHEVTAMVSGSELYKVKVSIGEVSAKLWASICKDCAGTIDSLVELLQGRFAKGVMERICRQGDGLFPKPSEIRFSCSCPDHASMCKHVAAVLYGVGARLDEKPELLFRLRAVDETDLLARLDTALPLAKGAPDAGKVLAGDDLSALFGLDMDTSDLTAAADEGKRPAPLKADRTETPAHVGNSDRTEKSVRARKLDRTAKPARANQSDGTTEPARTTNPERTGKADRAGKPDAATKPVGARKPERTTKPARAKQSDAAVEPVRSRKPDGTTRPDRASKADAAVEPFQITKPVRAGKPVRATTLARPEHLSAAGPTAAALKSIRPSSRTVTAGTLPLTTAARKSTRPPTQRPAVSTAVKRAAVGVPPSRRRVEPTAT